MPEGRIPPQAKGETMNSAKQTEEEKVQALTKKHGRSIGLNFGALSPKLSEQLKELRFVLEGADLKQFDADADAIVRLHVRGILPDAQVDGARKRLLKKIVSAIESTTRTTQKEV